MPVQMDQLINPAIKYPNTEFNPRRLIKGTAITAAVSNMTGDRRLIETYRVCRRLFYLS